MQFKTVIEPFRIKSIEPIQFTTRDDHLASLQRAKYNLFGLHGDEVLVDMLTDSGTGAMSNQQWAGMLLGDESYAGSRSFYKFEAAVQDITGFKHVIPTHQGRAAERILFSIIAHPGCVILNNNHFDTTRANIEYVGAEARDLVIEEGHIPGLIHPFKGCMDVELLRQTIREVGRDNIPLVMLTVTNNSGGGQPVSMANIRAVSEVCHEHGLPFFLDACRFAENAWFIKTREDGYRDKTPLQIAQEMFSYADGCTMSAKKDGLANIGGFLALNNDDLAMQCRNLLILTEGFPTYGGLAGYDLEAVAQGLREVLDEHYLEYRVRTVAYLAEKTVSAGIPIIQPPGGHALFIDAKAMLPHIPVYHYPAQALAIALYLEGGIRGVEIGSVMFGKPHPDGTETPAQMELVRLAFPRRTFTQSHIDYVAEVLTYIHSIQEDIRGVRITWQPPFLRHFTAHFEPL
ncbi:MAG: tryptophanase [Anaerolineae bacterium]|nr:tryptophanase [Anaerolineae bacterium]